MAAKIVIFVCAQAILAQMAFSQCCGSGFGNLGGISGGLGGFSGIGGGLSGIGGCGCGSASTSGGNFPTVSASPNQPTGISVQSENQYEGQLCLGGNVPFLGTVALEGQLPTGGQSSVCYGCGSGDVGITSERGANTGVGNVGSYQGSGCGCGCGSRW